MAVQHFDTLDYQAGHRHEARRAPWLGTASLACWGATVLLGTVFLVISFNAAKGLDDLIWLLAAFITSWVGCGTGALLGFLAAFPWHRRQPHALTGLFLNLLTGAGPAALLALLASRQ